MNNSNLVIAFIAMAMFTLALIVIFTLVRRDEPVPPAAQPRIERHDKIIVQPPRHHHPPREHKHPRSGLHLNIDIK